MARSNLSSDLGSGSAADIDQNTGNPGSASPGLVDAFGPGGIFDLMDSRGWGSGMTLAGPPADAAATISNPPATSAADGSINSFVCVEPTLDAVTLGGVAADGSRPVGVPADIGAGGGTGGGAPPAGTQLPPASPWADAIGPSPATGGGNGNASAGADFSSFVQFVQALARLAGEGGFHSTAIAPQPADATLQAPLAAAWHA